LGFIIFRFLDILKPFPIGTLEKRFTGGLGVVIDDVVAGILGNLILRILSLLPWDLVG
jgi:phosphatidylglycerophosphatase A